MSRRYGAWVRYGKPLTSGQLEFAIDHYRVAFLQPWETEALGVLKAARPDMTVLMYKCLSSTRSYETGNLYSSGVSYEEAGEAGEHWFGHRADGTTRIEWNSYAGHWQMAVWNEEYRERWCDNVADELEGTLWDGVMADNDVFDDYYGLKPPLEGGRTMVDLRAALDEFVPQVGARLNGIGKLLIPNIAESRRDPGRWARHAAYGGGFEEVWLAYGPDDLFDTDTALAQADEVAGPGLTIMRTATDGTDTHRNFLYGLAAFWVFGGGSGGAYTATSHDGYDDTPFIPQLEWDLGQPVSDPVQRGNGWSRSFTDGWAAVNLNTNPRRKISYHVPTGLLNSAGEPAPDKVVLLPHQGAMFIGVDRT